MRGKNLRMCLSKVSHMNGGSMNLQDFEDMVEKMESDIYGFCLYLTRDRNQADDLYQETILKLIEVRGRIDMGNNPKSYMLAVAISIWKNELRREARHREIAPQQEYDNISEFVKDGKEGPEGLVVRTEEQNMLLNAVESLDDKFRIVLILFYYNHTAQHEIAKICNIPKGTVKSRLYKGRELVKKILIKEGYVYEK